MPRKFWLVKTEPDVFSIDDLAAARRTGWDGVRNFQARNFLREMKEGDAVLVYHSNADPPAAVGEAVVAREAYPDPTQFDPKDHHYDPKSKWDDPLWSQVDLAFVAKFPAPVGLPALREAKGLEEMLLLRKGNRLSVTPVTAAQYKVVRKLGGLK